MPTCTNRCPYDGEPCTLPQHDGPPCVFAGDVACHCRHDPSVPAMRKSELRVMYEAAGVASCAEWVALSSERRRVALASVGRDEEGRRIQGGLRAAERKHTMSTIKGSITEPHQMERRIRLGSDGNGVYVIWSPDGARTWRMHEHADRFAHDRDVRAALPADEVEAGRRHLSCEDDVTQYLDFMYLARFYRGEEMVHTQRDTLSSIAQGCLAYGTTAEIVCGERVVGRMGLDGLVYWLPCP